MTYRGIGCRERLNGCSLAGQPGGEILTRTCAWAHHKPAVGQHLSRLQAAPDEQRQDIDALLEGLERVARVFGHGG